MQRGLGSERTQAVSKNMHLQGAYKTGIEAIVLHLDVVLELARTAGMAELRKRLALDLTDALARHTEHAADLYGTFQTGRRSPL